ncbi:MAG: hypothetical protein IT328_05805 [Caldilineaceae bacterium]|nr:hypothetical protein [Caldilineaceae bacterium]
MQARPKIVKILVVALLVSLILAACGGGSTGKTWFNLPSAKVHIQPDGAMRVWGLNVGYFPQPALIQQLQAANVQQLEIRIGYNGIHVLANGQDLPYIKWDEASVQTLQGILPQLPNVPNANMIASALPWLRTIGLGVVLDMPLAQGQSELDIPRWSGESTITATTPTSPTLGPITIGSLAFDPQGQAIIEGVPASTLEQALGVALPSLDANTLGILQGLGAQVVQVKVQPNGIDLSLNDRPLPGIAWDEPRLNTLLTNVPAFVADPALVETLNQVVPLLNGADVTLAVSFTGEQAADTVLAPIELNISETGDLSLLGIPVAPGAVPADALASLQKANVQQLALSVQPTGLYIAANGQTLPTVTWTEESLPILAQVIGPMAGGADLINTVLPVALGLGPNVKINVPPAAGAAAVEVPDQVEFAIQPVEAAAQAPVLNVNLAVDGAGNLLALGGFTAEEFSQLGISLPTLPVESLAALRTAGVQQLDLDTEPGILNVLLDGSNALSLNYDEASIMTTLDIATPFLGDSPITVPEVNQLLREQIIPQVLVSNANVTVDLE